MARTTTAAFIVSAILALASCSTAGPYELTPGELFPHGKPVGQPRSSRQPEIRMVRVSSVQEAERFRTALVAKYPGCKIRCARRLPPGSREAGVIRIDDETINARGIAEIHFVETIKPHKKH